MKHLFKLPDFEGGFIYKSIENNRIVTRDNEFVVCNVENISPIEKGIKISEGKIIDFSDNVVLLEKNGKKKTFKKSLINGKIIEQGKYEYYLQDDYLITGTFETPSGNVYCEGQPEIIRKALTQPNEIRHNKDKDFFFSRVGNNEIIVEVQKPIIGTKFVKSINSKKILQPQRKLLVKAFGVDIKTPEVKVDKPKADLHSEGEQKAGHKYIERKLNPNRTNSKNKYIYLYDTPKGEVWKDAEGNEVNQATNTNAGNEHNLNFTAGTFVNHNGRIARVKDASDNYLWIEHENKKVLQIDKRKYLEQLATEQGARVGDSFSLPDGSFAHVKRISDNIIMLQKKDGTFEYIRKKQPITQYQTNKKNIGLNLPSINEKQISSVQAVLQGYNNDDDFFINNYEYENEPSYELFRQSSTEGGYGKQNDLRYSKYVKVDDTTYSISRFFDPRNNMVDVQVNGLSDYKIYYKGDAFIVRDLTEEGFAVEDKDGDLYFIKHDELKSKEEPDRYKNEDAGYGGSIIKDTKRQIFNLKPEYTPEELARFTGKSNSRFTINRKKLEEQFVSQARQKEMEAEADAMKKRDKEILNSQNFIDDSIRMKNLGYEQQENPFVFKKKAEVEGAKFEITNRYDKDKKEFIPEVEGHFKTVEIDGEQRPIIDINSKTVTYSDQDGKEKHISIEELKEKNGKAIFTKLGGKAILGKRAKIYMPNGDERNAQYAIVELDDVLASHNEETFNPTSGFPLDERGNTVNDRNYQQDKNAQNLVREYAKKYDARNISDGEKADSAVTISKDFIVLSGNNRTMSAKLASKEYPERWKEYQNTLKEKAKGLGFTDEDLQNFKNPFFVRIDNDFSGEYNKEEFAKYNEREGKAKTAEQNSATFGEILKKNKGAQKVLTNMMEEAESLSDIYRNPNRLNDLKNVLMNAGIIQQHTMPEYFEIRNGDPRITPAGKGLVNQLMLGMVFDEDTLYNARKEGMNEISENFIGNIGKIAKNQSLNKEYTLRDSINEAVNIEASYLDKKDDYKTFEDFLSQPTMFGDSHSREAIAINLLAKKGKNYLGYFINKYNGTAEEAQEGSMFGDSISRDEIIDNLINSKNPFTAGNENLFTNEEKRLIEYGAKIKKSFINRLLKSIRKSIEGFNEKHPRDDKGRFAEKNYLEQEYKKFCKNVVGEYKTPIGTIHVRPEDFVKIYGVYHIGKLKFKELTNSKKINWQQIATNQKQRGELTTQILKELLEKPTRISKNVSKNIQGDYVFVLENNARTYYLAISENEALKTAGIFAKKYTHEKIEGEQIFPEKRNPLQKAVDSTSEFPTFASGSDSRRANLVISDFVVNTMPVEINKSIPQQVKLFGKKIII